MKIRVKLNSKNHTGSFSCEDLEDGNIITNKIYALQYLAAWIQLEFKFLKQVMKDYNRSNSTTVKAPRKSKK